MVRRPVDSSMATSIGYDPESATLEIEFRSGEIWQYYGVQENVFYEMKSVSIGKYFQLMIKNKYKEKRIR
ncbi:KTSC domain-containing protein [Pseudochryseolinea flava]|uniref:KTSC domain-containing protein n=1 Tax=Pseudochryseolinea flava TaxID=2059302 RepID=A0A364Y1T0_9BACT|nr:KTSC domain-containing protein [Pseudochryseolinea flava]RAW00590.1 KTSC domain-containing protein [Pseudochryseolinea flava]